MTSRLPSTHRAPYSFSRFSERRLCPGGDEIGQKLYDLVMGGREIANANERSDAVSGNSSVGELSEDRRERLSHSPLALPLDIAKII